MVIMKALGQSVLKLQTDLRGLCHLLKIHVEREDLLWLVIINTKDIGVRSKPTQNLLAGYRANLNTQTSTGANVEKNHQALITLAQLFINTFLAKIQFQLILMLMSIVIWKLKKKKKYLLSTLTDKTRVAFSLPRKNLGSEVQKSFEWQLFHGLQI